MLRVDVRIWVRGSVPSDRVSRSFSVVGRRRFDHSTSSAFIGGLDPDPVQLRVLMCVRDKWREAVSRNWFPSTNGSPIDLGGGGIIAVAGFVLLDPLDYTLIYLSFNNLSVSSRWIMQLNCTQPH